MKRIICAFLLSLLLVSLTLAVDVIRPISTVRMMPVPTSTEKEPPFERMETGKSLGAIAGGDKNTGKIWMRVDAKTPGRNFAAVLFKGALTRATGRVEGYNGKLCAIITYDLPEGSAIREVYPDQVVLHIEMRDSLNRPIRLVSPDIANLERGVDRRVSAVSEDVVPAGNYVAWAGFSMTVRKQGGLAFISQSANAKIKKIQLLPDTLPL